MKAWQVTEWCEPEGMHFNDITLPEPQAGEVRIRNHAAALNFFDILMVQGKYQVRPPFPFTPGSEVAGVIDAVGAGVTTFNLGDRVQAMASSGGYAEYSLAPAAKTFRIPDKLGFAEAAAMPVIYQTSYLALNQRGQLQAGETLLVLAAAGGVGMSAMQIGKAMGARVIAAVGSDDKFEFCLANGADAAVNYNATDWTDKVKSLTNKRGADVIYDPVGADYFDQALKCIAVGGRLLVIGFAAGRIPSVAANRILFKNISIVGAYWGGYLEQHPGFLAEAQRDLLAMYEAGQINPVVTQRYALTEAPAAMRALAERRVTGKAVLTM
jgi:NADPH2:quinone reductase